MGIAPWQLSGGDPLNCAGLMPWNWPAWCWPWVGGVCAVTAEWWFRTHLGVPYMRQWVPMGLAIGVNYAVYKIFQSAPSLIFGFLAFSTATLLLRVAVTVLVLREAVGVRTWMAVGLLLAAKHLMR